MNKNTIRCNNRIKFAKNKDRDKKLRCLDNQLLRINKKIAELNQDSFIIAREQATIAKVTEQFDIYCLEKQKKYLGISRIMNKIALSAKEIEIVYLSLKKRIDFHTQEKKSLEKKCAYLINNDESKKLNHSLSIMPELI